MMPTYHRSSVFLSARSELFLQQEEIDREVHTEQRHEHRRDRLRISAVARKGVCLDGKATRARSCKGVAERIKKRHAAGKIKDQLHERQGKIYGIKNLRRVDHPRHHLADRGSGALRTQQMDALPALHF